MIEFELKAIVIILLIFSIIINFRIYSEDTPSGMPKKRFWFLMLASITLFICLFICGLYLNEYPIILF